MTSPSWTRAIFVRDPKERLLSAYLDRIDSLSGEYGARACCRKHLPVMKFWNGTVEGWVRCVYKEAKANGANSSRFDSSTESTTTRCNLLRGRRKFEGSKAAIQCVSNLSTFARFVDQICDLGCSDPHWVPQSQVVDEPFWPYINFVGHLDTAAKDMERLFRSRLGKAGEDAWQKYGASGWGKYGNESMFQGSSTLSHSMSSKTKHDTFYSAPGVENKVRSWYQDDYQLPALRARHVSQK